MMASVKKTHDLAWRLREEERKLLAQLREEQVREKLKGITKVNDRPHSNKKTMATQDEVEDYSDATGKFNQLILKQQKVDKDLKAIEKDMSVLTLTNSWGHRTLIETVVALGFTATEQQDLLGKIYDFPFEFQFDIKTAHLMKMKLDVEAVIEENGLDDIRGYIETLANTEGLGTTVSESFYDCLNNLRMKIYKEDELQGETDTN